MSIEENKVIARRWNDEIYSKGNVAVIDELFATDFVWHTPWAGLAPDREGYKQSVMPLVSFSDVHCATDDMVAEGDKVAIRWTWSGSHTSEYMGFAPTGKRVTMAGISILRIVGGRIVEEWDEQDNLGFMQQLGAFPA
jgi:predicted ester cyclase